ncbi:MAG: hypothetical protein ACKO40_04535 [Planctomycetaceae bacterium]
MKKPSISVAGMQDFFLRHGEKFVVGLLGLFALMLLWGGANALRLKSAQQSQTPQAINALATQTMQHIDRSTDPPADIVRPKGELAAALEPWRPQHIKVPPAPTDTTLNRPFAQDVVKRPKPEVLPIEDLRAVAGVTILPDPAAAPGFEAVPGGEGVPPDGRPRRRLPPGRQPAAGAETPPASSFGEFGGAADPTAVAEVPGRVAAYVVVTGLVPVAKQREEFARCFAGTGFQNPQGDLPHWGQYAIERAAVVNGAVGKWERLKVAAAAAPGMGAEGGGGMFQPGGSTEPLQDDRLPPQFMMGPSDSDVPYSSGLPQLLYDGWGTKAIHPWFLPELRKLLDEQQQTAVREPEVVAAKRLADDPKAFADKTLRLTGVKFVGEPLPQPAAALVVQTVTTADGTVSFSAGDVGAATGVVFVRTPQLERELGPLGGVAADKPCELVVRIEKLGATPVARVLSIQYLDDTGVPADEPIVDPNPFPLSPVMAGGEFAGGEMGAGSPGSVYRLFRYVDRTVRPGVAYTYRVRLTVGNPNFGVESRFLADAAAGKTEVLVSNPSNESPPVTVPQPPLVVVRPLGKDDAKLLKLRKEAIEMLVLGPANGTGNYRFSRVVTEPGGLVLADPATNPKNETRIRDRIDTGRIVVDVRGRQQEDDPATTGPREMLETLVLGPDGSLEVVSYAESEPLFSRYRTSLPKLASPDDKRPRPAAGQPRGADK